MLDKSNANMDDMEDFERQIQDFFIEVRTKLEMGNKEDAMDLLQANYEAVKEQMDDGAKGVEQAAVLDVIALGYMGVGNLKFVEHLLDMVILWTLDCIWFKAVLHRQFEINFLV